MATGCRGVCDGPRRGKTPSTPQSDPSATESLRRVTRIFEIIGELSDDDRTLLRSAARSHLATVMPTLSLLTAQNAA